MTTCRPEEGGSPLCRLGQLPPHLLPKTIEVRGNAYKNLYYAREYNYRNDQLTPLPYPLKGHFDILIVNESPSPLDDHCGLPLQNPDSGAKLHEFIEKAGLDQDRIYVTNIVKCKAPKRKPSVTEIKTCRDAHLMREIAEVDPKVIILLGSIAGRLFNLHTRGNLNNIHGQVFELPLPGVPDSPTFKVIPTFNPAAFLFRPNPQLEKRVVQDYRNANLTLQGQDVGGCQFAEYTVCDTVEKVQNLVDTLKTESFFAFDSESAALPWTKNPMLCLSFSWGHPGKSAVLPFYQHDPDAEGEFKIKPVFSKEDRRKVIDSLREVFENPESSIGAFNIKYDLQVLRKYLDIEVQGFFFDGMVMHHLLSEEPPHNLEALVDEEFGYGNYSEELHQIVGRGKNLLKTYDHVPDEILWPYAATDAEACWRLCERYYSRLIQQPHLWKFYCEESEPLLKALAEAEWHGAKIDLNIVDKLYDEYSDRQEVLLSEMQKMAHPEFNPLSPLDVPEAFQKLGYGEAIRDPKAAKGYSANKKVLNEIKDDVPLAGHILEYRTNRKMMSTYLNNARAEIDTDGRLRHSWFPLTVTGRLSCRFFHQIPKINRERFEQNLPVMRDMFTVEPGATYIYSDFSQIELHILAILSQDEEMLRILSDPDQDLHAATTYEFLKNKIPGYTEAMAKADKENRTEVGKRINFALAFGSEGVALVKSGKWYDKNRVERSFTWDMLDEGLKQWRKRFRGVGKFIEETPMLARAQGGIVRNVFGRERRLGARLNSPDEFQRGEAEREAVNFPIQSVSGSVTNRTIVMVHQVLEKFRKEGKIKRDDVFLINTVHDSVAYECRNHLVNWFCKLLIAIGERAIPELQNHSFTFDIGVGQNWTQAEMTKINREALYEH